MKKAKISQRPDEVNRLNAERLRDELAGDKLKILSLENAVREAEMKSSADSLEMKKLMDKAARDKVELKALKERVMDFDMELETERATVIGLKQKLMIAKKEVGELHNDLSELLRLRDEGIEASREIERLDTKVKAAELKAAGEQKEMERLRREVVDTRKEVAELKFDRRELARQKASGIWLQEKLMIPDDQVADLEIDRSKLVGEATEYKLEPPRLSEMAVPFGDMESTRPLGTVIEGQDLIRKRQKTSYRGHEDFRIWVTGPSKVVEIDVKSSLTVSALKGQLHVQNGMPNPDEQSLIYEGNVLEDSLTLYDCGIEENAYLKMEWTFLGPISIFVQDKYCKQAMPLDVKRSDTIKEVKAAICRHNPSTIMKHQQLMLNKPEQIRRNDLTLAQLGVDGNSTLYFTGYLGSAISVRDRRGETIHLRNVPGWEPISVLKGLVHEQCDTPTLEQRLMYEGVELLDHETLLNRAVPPHSTLDMICGFISPVQLHVTNLMMESLGPTFFLKAKRSDTVAKVKALIRLKHGLPVDQQALTGECIHDQRCFWKTSWKPLDDNRTLGDYRFPKVTNLDLITGGGQVMQIGVVIVKRRKDYGNSLYTQLVVFEYSTVWELKVRICHEQNRSIGQMMRFMYNGRQLEDGFTLVDYKIKDRTTLFLEMNLSR